MSRKRRNMNISTHDLTRRSTEKRGELRKTFTFQLTTSRGGRRGLPLLIEALSHFNSRPHEEVDTQLQYLREKLYYFNSRPHEEVDRMMSSQRERSKYFNSRPHEEVDWIERKGCASCRTFQLTTSRGGRHHQGDKIEGRTVFQLTTSRGGRPYDEFTARAQQVFQLTTSRGGRQAINADTVANMHFNSRPHEEVDLHWNHTYIWSFISTHDLTRRSTR